jgi:ATP-dependent Clp protease ATP-binding subunit ClpC
VFERFTERARQVVVHAQEEARTLRHNYIGTEHLLLGLLREDSTAAHALGRFAVTHEAVRAQVARIVGQGDDVATGQIPFTPRAKKVLELSLRETLDNSESYIGPEHILLGLVREGDGVGARILMDFAPLESIRVAVLERASVEGEPPPLAGSEVAYRRASRLSRIPRGVTSSGPRTIVSPLLVGWTLFAVALGVGVLIGWAIWG